jgi:hypothetical protein
MEKNRKPQSGHDPPKSFPCLDVLNVVVQSNAAS